MIPPARLAIVNAGGSRTVMLDKPRFTIGRRSSADIQLSHRDVSREQAEIAYHDGLYLIRDPGSRSGTFVNGERITERPLAHGDRIRFGRNDEVELVFASDDDTLSGLREVGSGPSDLRQMAAVLNGLRALGSGRVLEEVLTLVLDSAIDVTSADRGMIMLARDGSGELEFKAARARGHAALPDSSIATSHKVPREVFATRRTKIVSDLMDGELASAHTETIAAGIRHVLCVPLQVPSRAVEAATGDGVGFRAIGVLYLDGRQRGTLLSPNTRDSLEAFATQAALAIESARLYAEAAEKARMERDLRVAADIQRALLPPPTRETAHWDLAAASLPCRTVGGDFYDYLELGNGDWGFALGDVAGKGPPAALLAATVQSHVVAHAPVATDPADMMRRINRALLRRAVEARFCTMFYGTLGADGRLRSCNAGHEPPVVVRTGGGIEWLATGGPVLGLLEVFAYESAETCLQAGDLVVLCSDGVTEAQADDITAMVLRYRGTGR